MLKHTAISEESISGHLSQSNEIDSYYKKNSKVRNRDVVGKKEDIFQSFITPTSRNTDNFLKQRDNNKLG